MRRLRRSASRSKRSWCASRAVIGSAPGRRPPGSAGRTARSASGRSCSSAHAASACEVGGGCAAVRTVTRPRSSSSPMGRLGAPAGSENVTTAAARSRPPSVAGVPSATTSPRAIDDDPVGEPLGLLHVVRGEDDRLAERAQAVDDLPRARAARPGRSRSSARRGRSARGRRPARARRRAAGAGRPRAARVRLPRGLLEPDEADHLVDGRAGRSSSRRRGAGTRARSGRARRRTPAARCRGGRARRGRPAAGSAPSTSTSPAARVAEALEHLDGGGLAGAVGAEQGEDLAAPRRRGRCRARPRPRRRSRAARARGWRAVQRRG